MKSKSSKNTSVNHRVSVNLVEIARAFLAQNFTSSDLDEVLSLFESKDYKRAKDVYSVILSSSLCIGRDEYYTTAQLGAILFKSLPSCKSHIKSLEREALDKFMSTERKMHWVNWNIGMDKTLPNFTVEHRDLIARARWYIAGVLPELRFAMRDILRFSRPGSGVSLDTVDSGRSAYCYKYSEQKLGWYVNGQCYHLPLLAQSRLHQSALAEWHDNAIPTIHCSNKVTFVPKNVTSLRPIAIEPNGQMMMQLGVHEYLAKVLSRIGNDIRHQQRNQSLARIGSTDGSFATIDLASASDSISIALVYQLLPSDWFTFLYQNRAPKMELADGTTHIYEKFSSMGNGMTFALETLIFYALARAVCKDGLISVYGDDIIVPTQHSQTLIGLLECCGFTINEDKTFLDGPFRESCGADWYQGHYVTPKYWRASDRPLVSEVYEFYNSCSRIAPQFNWGKVRKLLRDYLKDSGARLLFGPIYMPENSCIHAPESYLKSISRRWDKDLQTYRYRVLVFKASRKRADEQKPQSALAMLRHGTIVSYLPLRRVGKYRHVWMA